MEHHKMSNEDINLGDALGAVFGQPTEVAPGITAYGLMPNTDESWLRAEAAIEEQSLRRVPRIDQSHGVSHAVEALVIEGCGRAVRIAPVPGRHVRPAHAGLELLACWGKL